MMKILWVINLELPILSKVLGKTENPFGGWLLPMVSFLSKNEDIELWIAYPVLKKKKQPILSIDGVTYIPFENNSTLDHLKIDAKMILNFANPDLIHIHGTEFLHARAFQLVSIEEKIPHVVTIQGLISECAKHYMCHLPNDVKYLMTFRDFVKKNRMIDQMNDYKKRGLFEVSMIKDAKNIIGRTSFDHNFVKKHNPKVIYHHLNESLRPSFYDDVWHPKMLNQHMILMSQASYPLKGLHQVLLALSILIQKYKGLKLYVAGPNIFNQSGLLSKLKLSGYAFYINQMIKRLKLEPHVTFIGVKSELEMKEVYLSASLFVSASSMENSSNSVSEAMILGLPVVSSNVGGISSLIDDQIEGLLYPSNDVNMLASQVDKILSDHDFSKALGKNARKRALKDHDVIQNGNQLLEIYQNIT
jgi:glycosyltransferase involved in cell wall biosynthesis